MRKLDESSNHEENASNSIRRSISEEVQDLVMSSDGEGPGPYFPPPHIAARFNRLRNNRHKSSAASSRRNSLSSHHSSRSTRSAHGGPQSTHIAQHLRRASILETRKARLADKAAHAEKVRLRAALAKAAPRLSTNSEERAAAAKQARERFLAQVAANCAEEVRRAKRVAEDTKEKKAAEHLKLKGDMEERLAETERRRALYQQNQRRSRTLSLPPVEEKKAVLQCWSPGNEDQAARLIQKFWRNRRRRQIVLDFMQLGLTVENIRQTSFEDAGALLSQENVLTCTSKLLKLFGLQDSKGIAVGDNTAARTFLSTFLLLGHPAHVLSQEGEREKDLIVKAEALLLSFGEVVSTSPGIHDTLPLSSQSVALAESYSSFQAAFSAWKDHDSSVLVQAMVAQFVELDAIWQTVKNDTNGDVAADYREGIRRNQTQLLVRLKRLAGPEDALKMIKLGVRRNRKSKLKQSSVSEVKSRATSNVASSSSTSASRSRATRANVDPDEPSIADLARELRNATSLMPDNRTVVHELAINKEYRIDMKTRMEMRDDIVQVAVWSMRRQLASGTGDGWIVAMAGTVREKLLGLVTPGKPLYHLISESLDPNLVASQVKFGSFSYQQFFSFMDTVLPKLCAPVRDAEVKALTDAHSEDPIERLANLNFVIDQLSLDNANFTLQSHAPLLIKEAAIYEHNYFAKIAGRRPLSRTLRWWVRARGKLEEEASRRAVDGVPLSANGVTSDKTYMRGLIDLALAVSPLQVGDLPETLELDRERITRIRANVLRMVTIESILVTAKNLLKRDVRSQWKAEAQRMWELPYDTPQAFLSVIDSRHAMPLSTKTQLSGTIERVLVDARASQTTHAVMKVLRRKLKVHVFTRLSASSAEERARAMTTASEVLSSVGLPEFVEQIGTLVGELARVGEVDRAAHGKWYDEISVIAATEQDTSNEP